HDGPAAPAVDLHVPPARRPQPVDQIREVLDVAALVGAHGHALDILLDGGGDDLVDGTVVAQVDDLRALGLQEPAHDVDRRVVTVEQAGGGHKPDGISRAVQLGHQPCSLPEN